MEGSKRFNEIQRVIGGISARVLSNELKELELNGFVKRIVHTQTPVVVEYELTDYADSLGNVLESLSKWGTMHRDKIRKERVNIFYCHTILRLLAPLRICKIKFDCMNSSVTRFILATTTIDMVTIGVFDLMTFELLKTKRI